MCNTLSVSTVSIPLHLPFADPKFQPDACLQAGAVHARPRRPGPARAVEVGGGDHAGEAEQCHAQAVAAAAGRPRYVGANRCMGSVPWP